MEQFLNIFGDFSIRSAVELVIALVFIFGVFIKIRNYFIDKAESDRRQQERVQEVIDLTLQYPTWRKQSITVQKELTDSINKLDATQKEQAEILRTMEEARRKKELNELFDRLLTWFQYYTNEVKNPQQAWTEMESSAFSATFADYEERGGDGYMHTVVQPKMQALSVIPMHETERIADLMHSRK